MEAKEDRLDGGKNSSDSEVCNLNESKPNHKKNHSLVVFINLMHKNMKNKNH